MLELKDICFTRENRKILDHINLTIDSDKFIVITGPNGSGKSTLAKIIMGIEQPDEGKVLFEGKDITDLSIDKRAKLGIGFAFQQPVKFKGITVYDLLKLSAEKEMNKGEACNILSKVGLCAKEYVDREVNDSLSGGELKRIEIATVIARMVYAWWKEPLIIYNDCFAKSSKDYFANYIFRIMLTTILYLVLRKIFEFITIKNLVISLSIKAIITIILILIVFGLIYKKNKATKFLKDKIKPYLKKKLNTENNI